MSFFALKLQNLQKFSVSTTQICRHLSLQENISYKLLNDHKIKTPRYGVAKCDVEADKVARDLLTKNLMVKAQVLAGGRGLGRFKNGFKGGVHSATSPEEIKEITAKMIGQRLVTKQTGPEGKICNCVMVSERKFARREFYFAIAMEREFNGPVVIASRFGGVNIEDVAADSPEAIICEPIDQCTGMTKELATWIAKRVGICDQPADTIKMLCNLYDLFVKKDALLAEINPWVEDVCMNYYALDAKLKFDDSAKFRQQEIFCLNDETQEDPKEVAANKLNLNYITLDGSIGCMVNGSGLAMATMDILKFHGGNPANFLDVGGMATVDAVKESVGIIMMDPKVKTIFVNIYAGIMRCDVIVEGLMKAIKAFDIKIPVVVRLQGNMVEVGQKMIRQANINVITRDDFSEAAQMAVRCSQIIELADGGDLEAALKMKMQCECDPIPPRGGPKSPFCPPDGAGSSGSGKTALNFKEVPVKSEKKASSRASLWTPVATVVKLTTPVVKLATPVVDQNPATSGHVYKNILGAAKKIKVEPAVSPAPKKYSTDPKHPKTVKKQSKTDLSSPKEDKSTQNSTKKPEPKDPFSNGDTFIV